MKNLSLPQANNLEKVFDLILNIERKSSEELMHLLGLSSQRQLAYYTDAGIYLDLIHKDNAGSLKLTNIARRMVSSDRISDAKILFLFQVLRCDIVRSSVVHTAPDFSRFKSSESYLTLSAETRKRRASTLKSWTDWLIKHLDDFPYS